MLMSGNSPACALTATNAAARSARIFFMELVFVVGSVVSLRPVRGKAVKDINATDAAGIKERKCRKVANL
jgi:hypothetical protein